MIGYIRLMAAVLLFTSTSVANAATAYVRQDLFDSAIAKYGMEFVIGFDGQATGSSANKYGMLEINAEGLRSDGLTLSRVQPIATNAFSTVSNLNSMGGDGSEAQFLSGNDDRIVFKLSYPVNAFAVRLIGNPSPVSEKPGSFWRMNANIGTGFDAYSGIEPYRTLSRGNDVYFVGIVSPDVTFDTIELFSDNDTSAVFSFNVDDIAVAADVKTLKLAEVKFSDPQPVVVSDVVVTRVHSSRFNVENKDRSAGLAILGTGATRGRELSLFGTVSTTSDGEQVMNLIHLISDIQPNSATPAPLGIGNHSIGGGGSLGKQAGCTGSIGLNNIGLDVVVWGKVTKVDTGPFHTWITINDGSGRDSGMGSLGVKVEGPAIWGNGRAVGDMVRVQGSSSIFNSGSEHYPVVRVANWDDIITLYRNPAY